MFRFSSILLTLVCLAGALSASAQQMPQELQRQLSSYLTQADFSYVSESDVKVQGEGKFCVQDSCYVLDLGMLQIYCDGNKRWTVDKEAKEVYIESVKGSLAGEIAGYALEDVKGLSDGGLVIVVRGADGTRTTLTIPRMKMTAKAEAGFFRFSTLSLGGDWSINDLTD